MSIFQTQELEFSLKAWDKLCEHQANGGGGSGSSSSGGKGFLLGKVNMTRGCTCSYA